MTRWPHYEQRKAAWVQTHPGATSEEYEQAARSEFRGDKSRKARARNPKRSDATASCPCVPHVAQRG